MSGRIEAALWRLATGILAALSRLPMPLLYLISSAMAWLARCVVRYRRGVVRGNLAACFPDFTPAERLKIEREFYRNFADYIVETLKLLTISPERMRRLITFTGLENVNDPLSRGQSVIAYFSHTFNWEWATAFPLAEGGVDAVFSQVYRPLRNKAFDRLMLRMRGRFGSVSLPKATVLRSLLRYRAEGCLTVTGFMSDQKPSHGDPTCKLMFLNRPTAMITGTETLATKLRLEPVYFDLVRVSRGHYRLDVKKMTPTREDMEQPFPLTRLYARMLQQSITRRPASWLWTHNRWKYPVTL